MAIIVAYERGRRKNDVNENVSGIGLVYEKNLAYKKVRGKIRFRLNRLEKGQSLRKLWFLRPTKTLALFLTRVCGSW